MLKDIALLKCPVCRTGTVFKGLFSMNADCPHCGVHFERENGYFMGAMWIAYGLGAMSLIPTIILLVRHYEAEMPAVVATGAIQLILMQPLLFIYSRMIWLYIDRASGRKDWQ